MNASCALHPDTAATGTCSRCGNFVCGRCELDDAKQCPSCVKLVGASTRVVLPWERRAELGLVSAFFAQAKLAVFKPGEYVAAITPEGSWRDAFFFGWLVSGFVAVVSIPYNAFNFWSQGAQMKQSLAPLGNGETIRSIVNLYEWLGANPLLAAAAMSLYTVAIYPPMFFLNSGTQQLGLALAGATDRKPITATMRASAYGHAVNVLLAIPVIGGLAGIYSLVLQVWALRTVHNTTTMKAVVASLWFSIVLGCCGGVAAVGFAAKLLSKS
ncbi:MAG: hypothetical protein GQE15_33275 [Archangiaceae bacterium]|nr:hypothetical protein [Archangiaceae bacterium]